MNMAPIGWIILILILLIFGVPLLLALRDVIIEGLGSSLDGVSPGVRSLTLLAMVLITVVGLARAWINRSR